MAEIANAKEVGGALFCRPLPMQSPETCSNERVYRNAGFLPDGIVAATHRSGIASYHLKEKQRRSLVRIYASCVLDILPSPRL